MIGKGYSEKGEFRLAERFPAPPEERDRASFGIDISRSLIGKKLGRMASHDLAEPLIVYGLDRTEEVRLGVMLNMAGAMTGEKIKRMLGALIDEDMYDVSISVKGE